MIIESKNILLNKILVYRNTLKQLGKVEKLEKEGTNVDLYISGDHLHKSLKVDQSLAHNGCCLTVVNQ